MPVSKKTPAAKTPAAPAKKTAVAKAAAPSTSRALTNWEEEMAMRAKKVAKQEVPFGSFKKIGTRGGTLSLDGEDIGDELRCIVIGALHENQFYTGAFDPSKPTVPDCYAFNDPKNEDDKPEDTMAAHAEAENPQGQDDPNEAGANGNPCNGCWANRMGSADVGRGKACKNIRRLALITEDGLESAEALADAEVRMLNVPVMSTRNWGKFVNSVADDMGRPYWGVVCKLGIQPDPKSQYVLTFEFEELINFDQDTWDAMQKKTTEAMATLLGPYPKQADLEQSKPVKPTGRLAQAMKKGASAKQAAPAKRGKF